MSAPLRCPDCGERTYVTETKELAGEVWRKRRCECSPWLYFTTREAVAVRDMPESEEGGSDGEH